MLKQAKANKLPLRKAAVGESHPNKCKAEVSNTAYLRPWSYIVEKDKDLYRPNR